jgi:hypothetical protein
MASWPVGRSLDGGLDEIALPGSPGRLWLCGKHAVAPDPDALMGRIGGTTLVCLTEPFELADRYPGYVQWLRDHADRVVWFPIPDLDVPTVASAVALLDDLHARLADGECVLVHCAAGFGRAGTVAACLLVGHGLTTEEAIAHVAACRPMAGPEVGAQRGLVEAIAQRTQGSRSL